MATNLYRGLLLSAAPSSAFFFGDTVGNKTIDVIGGNIAQWSASPTATVVAGGESTVDDPLGVGCVDTTNGASATISSVGGTVPCLVGLNSGYEMVIEVLQYPVLPVGDEAGMAYLQTGNSWILFASGHVGRNIAINTQSGYIGHGPYDYKNVKYHIFVRYLKSGTMEVYLQGALAFSGTTNGSSSSPNWSINGNLTYRLQMKLSVIANFARNVTPAEIADRAACLARSHKLAGVALLDNSQAASEILVRRVSDRKHIGGITPAADGSWSCYVPPGTYEVVALGPSGYRPVCDSPVTAVAT